jgi:arylsulfatase A-like enzyme
VSEAGEIPAQRLARARGLASGGGARRGQIQRLACALAAAALVACAGGTSAPPVPAARAGAPRTAGPRPDLVVLLADDLGTGDLGRSGGPARTPSLDRFFAEGLELRRFYTSPLGTPTRAALLTGRSAMELGLQYHELRGWSRQGLAPELETLPELLRRADYQTALVGKWHLGHASMALQPNEQGFDRFYGHLLDASHFDHEYLGARDLQRDGGETREKGYATELLGAELLRVLEERDPTRPLFLLGAFAAPHAPWEAPDAVVATYPKLGRDRRHYAAMLDVLDQQIGRVLAAIAASGRDTLVVFLSDNGAVSPPGSNAPLRGAKGSLFEGGIRVPAAIQWPGHFPTASASDQLIRDSDLFAILAAAAGLAPSEWPRGVDGSDLLPALAAGKTAPHTPLLFAVDASRAESHAVIDWPWKLIQSESRAPLDPAKAKATGPRARREREILLFDLAADPSEIRDRSADESARIAPLLEKIESWRATHPADGLRLERTPPKGWRKPQDWSLLR